MPYQLVFTEDYTRRALRFLKRHPDLKAQYAKTLALLEANPHHPSLRLHALNGRMVGLPDWSPIWLNRRQRWQPPRLVRLR